jgi:DNA-directed RNA polymerase specialized sigma24 family protein
MADSDSGHRPDPHLWQRAVDGDRDAFEQAVAPMRDLLIRNAHSAIEAQTATGALPAGTLNPEELAGETLVRAFEGRAHYSPRMSLRAWLLGLQQRALTRIAADEAGYRDRKVISLDEEVPFREDYDAVEEAFYEFRHPFDVTTFNDVIPSQAPDDIEIDTRQPLTDEELQYLEQSGLDPSVKQLVQLHDEFEMPLGEVAQILEHSLHDLAESLSSARVHVRQWLGSTDVHDATSDRDDRTDSYTGERLSPNDGR